MWKIEYSRSALRALRKMPRNMAGTISGKIVSLAVDPHAPNNNATRLQGRPGYRLRVGDWRVLYELGTDRIMVLDIRPRGRSLPMKTEIIERKGRRFVVVPLKDFEQLQHSAEMLEDIRAYDTAKSAKREMFPSEVAKRLISGDSPIRVFREHRGLTQAQLAKSAKIARPYLAELESGRKRGSVAVLNAIAEALKLELADIAE